jgi:hypothetical protein
VSDPADQKKNGAAPARIAADEERTHLLLDPICLEDDEEAGKETAPEEPPTRLMLDAERVKKALAPEEPPTRLMLDAERVKQEVARAAATAAGADGQKTVQLRPGAAGDARTQLMIGPLILKEEPMALMPFVADKPGWLLGHTRRLGFWLDERLHNLWGAGLVAGGLICGILAPLIDQGGDEPRSVATLLASLALLLGLAAFAVTWLGNLQTDGRRGLLAASGARLRGAAQLLDVDIRELSHSPIHLKLFLSGQWLAAAGFLGLMAVSAGSVMLWLSDLSEPPNAFRWLSGLMLLVGFAVARVAARYRVVAPTPEELEESVVAATKLAAIVDLSESLPPSFIDGYTPLHRILIALTQWRGTRYARPRSAGADWPDEAGYRAALERHLRRHLPACRIERAKWLGRTRADGIAGIVVDDMVAIEVARGFDPNSAARAIARLSDVGRTWRGKPMILAIFEAPREPVFQSAATASLIELHDRFPMLTVRMPVDPDQTEASSRPSPEEA